MAYPITVPIIATGIANTKPKARDTTIERKILPANSDTASAKKKKAENTTIVAHFVLAILNWPVYLSSL